MAGIIPGWSTMDRARLTLGYREVRARRPSLLHEAHDVVRGHEFHWSVAEPPGQDEAAYEVVDSGALEGYARDNVLASYVHLHFAADARLAPRLVEACAQARRDRTGLLHRPAAGEPTGRPYSDPESSVPSRGVALPRPSGAAPSRTSAEADLPPPAVGASLLRRHGLPPDEIEPLSQRRIETALNGALPTEEPARSLVARLVYAAGDPQLAALVELRSDPVGAALDALRRGAPIVVDVRMVAAGVNQAALARIGCDLVVALNAADARSGTADGSITRSAAGIIALGERLNGAVVAIGNAPTALLALLDLVAAGMARPAVVVGVPVGFVAAAESKEALLGSGLPCVVVRGTRGGSPLAAAAVNLLLRLAGAAGPETSPAAGEITILIVMTDPGIVEEQDGRPGLRTGFTTGACATAAGVAAARWLLFGEQLSEVTIDLPIGRPATFEIVDRASGDGWSRCSVVKDGGDDPDVTHRAEIRTRVRRGGGPGITFEAGEGVGTVTRPGLGLEIGGPAINPVPRQMLRSHLEALAPDVVSGDGLTVEVSIPNGETLARRTLNGRLGIVGGLSILGTTGIVVPYSTAAWRASVGQAIDVAAATGQKHVVLSTGGRSEQYAQRIISLPEVAFVEMGEFTGYALKRCVEKGVRAVSLSGMIGKMSKIAAGHFMTHVAGNQVDMRLLADLTAGQGGSASIIAEIEQANTARHVQEILLRERIYGTFNQICAIVVERSDALVGGALAVECFLFDFEGNVLGRAGLGRASVGRGP